MFIVTFIIFSNNEKGKHDERVGLPILVLFQSIEKFKGDSTNAHAKHITRSIEVPKSKLTKHLKRRQEEVLYFLRVSKGPNVPCENNISFWLHVRHVAISERVS